MWLCRNGKCKIKYAKGYKVYKYFWGKASNFLSFLCFTFIFSQVGIWPGAKIQKHKKLNEFSVSLSVESEDEEIKINKQIS